MNESLSEHYLHELARLPQFSPYIANPMLRLHVVHVLTGVRIFAVIDPLDASHGLLRIQFPAGLEIEVQGAPYLTLQRAEAAHYAPHMAYPAKDSQLANDSRTLPISSEINQMELAGGTPS